MGNGLQRGFVEGVNIKYGVQRNVLVSVSLCVYIISNVYFKGGYTERSTR